MVNLYNDTLYKMNTTLTIIFVICLLMFPLSGIDKIFNFKKSSDRLLKNASILSTGMADILIVGAIIIQLLAPIIIIYSLLTNKHKQIAVASAITLAIFTFITTIVFYFPPTGHKYYAMLGNLTTLGCMLLIAYELKYN